MIFKKIAFVAFCALFSLGACTKDDYNEIGNKIYDDEYTSTISPYDRELLLVVEPYLEVDGQKKYIVSDSIFNLSISINNKKWGMYSSAYYPTANQTLETHNSFYTTDDTAKYAVVAPQTYTSYEKPQTAGEFATVMTENLILEPGTYYVLVESFLIKDKQGNVFSVPVNMMRIVTIKESTKSAYIGAFEVDITSK